MDSMEMIGSYRLAEPLGSASSTFRAEHKETGEPVVVKVFRGERINADLWSEICHTVRAFPGKSGPVCVLTEVGLLKNEVYAVAPYMHGETLAQVIKALSRHRGMTLKPLHHRVCAWLIAELCSGVMARGSENFEHPVFDRDMVSPHELFVLFDGSARVLDVRWTWLRALATGSPWGSLERNVAYVPKLAQGEKRAPDAGRSWALGVMLWELLVGYRLFRRNSLESTLHAVAGGVVPDPRTLNPSIPKSLSKLVMRILDRPGTVSLIELSRTLRNHADFNREQGTHLVRGWLTELFPEESKTQGAHGALSSSVLDTESSRWSFVEESTTCIVPPPTLRTSEMIQLSWLEEGAAPRMEVVEKKKHSRLRGGLFFAACSLTALLVFLGVRSMREGSWSWGDSRATATASNPVGVRSAGVTLDPIELSANELDWVPEAQLFDVEKKQGVELTHLPDRAGEPGILEDTVSPVNRSAGEIRLPTPPPPVDVAPLPTTGDLMIRAPEGTRVSVGGQVLGTGTFRVRLPAGDHVLRFEVPSSAPSYLSTHVRTGAMSIVEIQ